MPLPAPEPGLVVCYEFLWSHEFDAGGTQGEKKRPCAIILASKTDAGQTLVTVAPITHLEPKYEDRGIEIPPRVKQHLGLDNDPSWVILDELNEFIWPGYDLYPIARNRPDKYDYGFLPPRLFDKIRDAITALDANIKRIIPRDEEDY
ncbi:type II toxin-antitoxin system PemK/MazF family toxin [Microvirga lotononidis]|uniref:PemK-like protein n=1 Tax=Microvirga lotononidis TaxID=864069 RepID=I4YRQ1_9HYPH|nr:type II toxin-antitoxin system PemK/MazF family toxin [Microvirga lotononidis]EIM26643.1 PemK-like protein [Microvirga lotononidis]WQO32076.1 type II toxin-antitoxin system PemK/MazF family toxin [Microvirga lotononidis]